MTQEIIEIGAFRLNRYGEILGEFNRFVRPILNPYLSPFCQELTSIEQRDVDRAEFFPDVVEIFQDWALIFEEDYLLCSWGAFDKMQLIQDCRLHDLDYAWVEPHLNLKRQYQEINRLRRPRGLKRAVAMEGFDFTGIHHRAIDDAENLVKVFRNHLDVWRF
jgi:3'-5' exoribonuclease 1